MSFANLDLESQTVKSKKGGVKNLIPSTLSGSSTNYNDDAGVKLTNFISTKLNDFITLSSKIDKFQKQLGTKRDNSTMRSNISVAIQQCHTLESQLSDNLEDLLTIGNIKSNPQIRYTENKLRIQCSEAFKTYHHIIREYNEKVNSVLINEKYIENNKELKAKEKLNQKLHETTNETTPLNPSSDFHSNYTSLSEASSQIHNPNHPNTQILLQQQQQIQQQQQLQQQQDQTQLTNAELEYHNALLQQREGAIQNIHTGVQDINAIFKDLGTMVDQQGQQIDTIEDNIMTYANANQASSHELTKADNYQKKKRTFNCMLFVFLVVVLLIFLAVIS